MLPFRLARQARVGPGGVGRGLVVTDMGHGRVRVERPQTAQGHDLPAVIQSLPIQRRLPLLGLAQRPAIGQPQLGAPVAVGFDKGQPFAVAYQAVADFERLQVAAMARPFVVESEAVAAMPHLDQAARHGNETPTPPRAIRRPVLGIGGLQRRQAEQVQQVHQQQFLVLLLVGQAQLHPRRQLGIQRRCLQ
ncbi:hypothetical protein D3C85_870410 [compost metagenome]